MASELKAKFDKLPDKEDKLEKLRKDMELCQNQIYYSENIHPAFIFTRPAPHEKVMDSLKAFFEDYYKDEEASDQPPLDAAFFANEIQDLVVPLSTESLEAIKSKKELKEFDDLRPVNYLYHNPGSVSLPAFAYITKFANKNVFSKLASLVESLNLDSEWKAPSPSFPRVFDFTPDFLKINEREMAHLKEALIDERFNTFTGKCNFKDVCEFLV